MDYITEILVNQWHAAKGNEAKQNEIYRTLQTEGYVAEELESVGVIWNF